jgi:hypothetical protein
MEQKIITSSSASGLNQKIAEMQKDGWEPIGSHSVVVVNEQKRFSGAQHSSTSFEHEYSQTMRRESVPTKEKKVISFDNVNKAVLAHMLGYLTEAQNEDARNQGLESDVAYLLGYLDTPQWIDAYKLFQLDDREALLKLAEKVDDTYDTNFRKEMINS